jgi:hypothetical protein
VWVGGALAALFGTLSIAASHPQITYYFLLVAIAFWINELVAAARAKNVWKKFCVATAVLAGAGALAFGANFTHLWYTIEHSPETTRGGSELVDTKSVDASGLDLEYATAWSYGIGESFNMFIPNFRGGGSWNGFEPDGEVADVLKRSGMSPSIATQLPGYWGTQPGTGGPTYIGAVIVFLFILGMFVLPGRKKWWVFGVSLLGLFLAWGSNMMWFTELAFRGLPGYNTFRAVATALAILQWSMPFLAALVMAKLWKDDLDRTKFMRGLWWSLGIAGGTALFFALFGGMIFDFSATTDSYYDGVPGLVDAVHGERAAMFRADCWRSLLLVALTACVVALHVLTKPKRRWVLVAALSGLVLADLVPVDLRYLSHDDFMTRSRREVKPDKADIEIMADKEPGFRVMNYENPFNEAYTSYFHRSVGGYHGAKLRRYQDIIDRYLSKFDTGVVNMLNTKYFIMNDPEGGRRAQLNPGANGAAWFVDNVFFVDGAAAELEALATIDNKREAVADERFEESAKTTPPLRGTPPQEGNFPLADYSDDAIIELIEYRPNYLRYESLSTEERVAVFSEIYYDKGWKAYIDGVEAPCFRADYILRAMVVPAGAHTIEWRFRAPRFALVEGITLACSIVILLWLAAAALSTGTFKFQLSTRKNGTGR